MTCSEQRTTVLRRTSEREKARIPSCQRQPICAVQASHLVERSSMAERLSLRVPQCRGEEGTGCGRPMTASATHTGVGGDLFVWECPSCSRRAHAIVLYGDLDSFGRSDVLKRRDALFKEKPQEVAFATDTRTPEYHLGPIVSSLIRGSAGGRVHLTSDTRRPSWWMSHHVPSIPPPLYLTIVMMNAVLAFGVWSIAVLELPLWTRLALALPPVAAALCVTLKMRKMFRDLPISLRFAVLTGLTRKRRAIPQQYPRSA